MKTKRMGRTGLKVSEICLGTMTFGRQCDEATSHAIMDTAVEYGVDFFDSADVYPVGGNLDTVGRSEEIVGKWLKGKRDRIVLATKCWGAMGRGPNERGLSRKHIFSAIEGSLRRLQTDYLDLYQVHAPDPDTPLDETLQALYGREGFLGVSKVILPPFAPGAAAQEVQAALQWSDVVAQVVGQYSDELVGGHLPGLDYSVTGDSLAQLGAVGERADPVSGGFQKTQVAGAE